MTFRYFNPVLVLVVLAFSGCGKPVVSEAKAKSKTDAVKTDDSLRTAMDVLTGASSLKGYREGLHLMNVHLGRPGNLAKLPNLSAENRQFLQQRLSLSEAEVKEVEGTSFEPLDGHYVEQCLLLRDAARALDRAGASPREQARSAFAWVDRQVRLREGVGELVPPLYVLRQGEGTSVERALVFLALLHQLNIPGCLVSVSETSAGMPQRVLAGAVVDGDKEKEIYLFDPRRGRPLAGPAGKDICTLSQLRDDPKLLGPETDKAPPPLRVFLALPSSSLSPRMKYLENQLAVRDRVALAIDAERLLKQVSAATDKDVLVWTEPISASAPAGRTPLRMLAAFLPPVEGGMDKSDRFGRVQARATPLLTVQQNFAAMRLLDELPPPAVEMLLQYSSVLFLKYVREPHMTLVAGFPERAFKRLEWMQNILEEMEFAPVSDTVLRKQIADWRDRVLQAYRALLVTKAAGAQEAVNRLWSEDQFLLTLIEAKERAEPKKHDKRVLSTIILSSSREPLGEATHYLGGLCWQDQAVRAAGMVGKKGKDSQRNANKARSNWTNARGWWEKYVERYPLRNLQQRLESLRVLEERGSYDVARIHRDTLSSQVRRAVAAQLFLADAQEYFGQQDMARATLRQLRKDLRAIREDSGWAKDVASQMERLGSSASPAIRNILESSILDLGPDGGFAWTERIVEERLADK